MVGIFFQQLTIFIRNIYTTAKVAEFLAQMKSQPQPEPVLSPQVLPPEPLPELVQLPQVLPPEQQPELVLLPQVLPPEQQPEPD